MTRDAKVGLLLGLVFIFVIAFIINGLPGLRGSGDGNDLTRNRISTHKPDAGIGAAAKQITRNTLAPIRPVRQIAPVQKPNISTGFETQSENPFPAVKSQQKPRYTVAMPDTSQSHTVSLIVPKTDGTSAVDRILAQHEAEQPETIVKPKEISHTVIYTVKEGDSLASIAKKNYGDELGNKKATVDGIFKANRKILKSPDNIYVGQKLVLPVINGTGKTSNIFSSDKFKPVESVGAPTRITIPSNYYTVKDGDSLWKIAEAKLGNGSRYTEIIKLNKFEDADMLTVGMRIKLPQK